MPSLISDMTTTTLMMMHLTKTSTPLLMSIRAMSGPAKKGVALGGASSFKSKGTVQKKKIFDVETDPKKLVSHCCGLNYKLEGDEVELKPDSEYPDWLWKMDVKRPWPKSDELEPGTLAYFKACEIEHAERYQRLSQLNRKIYNFKKTRIKYSDYDYQKSK